MTSKAEMWSVVVSGISLLATSAVAIFVAYHSGRIQERIATAGNQTQRHISVASNLTQADIARLNVQRDYVQLAVNILRDEPDKTPRPLRELAVAILEKNSPVPITDAMRKALLSEKLRVPPSGGFSSTAVGPGFGGGFVPRGYFPDGYFPDGWQPEGWHPESTQPRGSQPRGAQPVAPPQEKAAQGK